MVLWSQALESTLVILRKWIEGEDRAT